MAKLKKELFGAPDGEVYPRVFEVGEECPPELEAAAQHADALESAEEAAAREKAEAGARAATVPETKAVKPAENK